MKKLFSLVTVLLCVVMLSTTAFAASADPSAIYGEYLKNSENIKSLGLTVTQKMSAVDGADTVDIMKQDISVRMIMPSPTKMQMDMKMVDPTTGEVLTSYFKDDYLYQQIGKDKYKIKMDVNQALAATANVDVNLDEDMLKDAKFELVEEGVKITYKMDMNDLKDAQGNSMSTLLEGLELDGLKMSFSKITTTVVIGYDGMLKSGSNLFGIKISEDGEDLELKIAQSFIVNSVNKIDFIRFPDDLDSYQLLEI